MRVQFVSEPRHMTEHLLSVDRGSLLLMGHDNGIDIDLVSELDGSMDILKRMSEYSRRRELVIFCGITARIYRRRYMSVVAIDRGHILGISDATHRAGIGEGYNLGSSYRVYRTSLGMVGVIAGGDIYYPETYRALSRENLGYIVTLAGRIEDERAEMLLRMHSYLNGITTLSIVDGVGRVIDREGDVIFKENESENAVDIITSRDRTLLKGERREIYDNVYIEG